MANGSRRSSPTLPSAAAVFSLATLAPRKTPWFQSKDSVTSGTADARRPPKRIAEIGTPLGFSHSGAMIGHCAAGVVKRALGCAAGRYPFASRADAGVQELPFQSVRWAGVSSVMPSHQTSPSSVSATLVKTELPHSVFIALALVCSPVPGATPKKPASGLIAYSRPSSPNRIQAMSSPIVSTVQPETVGSSIERLVLPQALGKAAAT